MNFVLKCINSAFLGFLVFSNIIFFELVADYYFISLFLLFSISLYLFFYLFLEKIDECDQDEINAREQRVIDISRQTRVRRRQQNNNGNGNENPINLEPILIAIKVQNITEINDNYNDICPICIENIDPIDSYKLNICNTHIFHEECINLYVNNDYIICPLCNV